MDIDLRFSEPGDTPAIITLVKELAESIAETPLITETAVQKYLAFPGKHILLAEVDHHPAGMISYSIQPGLYHAANVCVIEELVTSSVFRRMGIGDALFERVMQIAREEGCAELGLGVLKENTGAIAFYEKHGLEGDAFWMEIHFPEEK